MAGHELSGNERSQHPYHSTLPYMTTHSSTAVPLLLSSTPHNTSQMLNSQSAPMHSRPLYIPAEQIPLLYSQGDNASTFDVPATVPPSLTFRQSLVPQGNSQNVAHLSAATPVTPNRPFIRNGRPIYGNGSLGSSIAQQAPHPLHTAKAPQSVETFTFIGENPANLDTPRQRRPRTEAHGQAVKSTIGAGGACVWCQARKKGCGSEIPCKSCAQRGHPCIRGSSALCLASTIKNNMGRQRLNPDNFQRARDIMMQLKNDICPPPGLVSYTTVFVDWTLYPHEYHKTLVIETAQLDLHQLDTNLQTSLVNLILSFVAVPEAESSEFSDPLNQSALKMVRLLAAICQLSKSNISAQPMAVGVARVTVFFLMTVYGMEMCNASVHFAEELYTAIRNRKLAGRSEQHALMVYSQVINKIMTLRHTGSLISAIFAPIRARLEGLRDIVRKLRSPPLAKRKFVSKNTAALEFSNLKPFHIAIGLKSAVTGTPPTASSRQEMSHNQLRYRVEYLLREDFDLGMMNGHGHGHSILETIDPYLLSPEMATQTTATNYESSTNVYSVENYSGIFSGAVGSSQNTDTTYTHRDGMTLYPDPFQFANATTGYANNSSNSNSIGNSLAGGPFGKETDFSNIGTHFAH